MHQLILDNTRLKAEFSLQKLQFEQQIATLSLEKENLQRQVTELQEKNQYYEFQLKELQGQLANSQLLAKKVNNIEQCDSDQETSQISSSKGFNKSIKQKKGGKRGNKQKYFKYTGCIDKLKGHIGSVNGLVSFQNPQSFSYEFATVSNDCTLKIWDLMNQNQIGQFEGHKSSIDCVAYMNDGNCLATGSQDKTIKIWSLNKQKCKNTIYGHSGAVRSLGYDTVSKKLFSGSNDCSIKVWDIIEKKFTAVLKGHQATVWALCYHPLNFYLFSGSSDQTVKCWDMHKGTELFTINTQQADILSVLFLEDLNLLATGSNDKSIKLFDISSGKLVKTLIHYNQQSVWSLAQLQNSNPQKYGAFPKPRIQLASCSINDAINIWDISEGVVVETLSKSNLKLSGNFCFIEPCRTFVAGDLEGKIATWTE